MRRNSLRMNEDMGAIGIGAMIVFIALILVAAVASAVIIQTGEKLQQNAQQTGDDTREEIGGKISIITVWVGDQIDCDGDEAVAGGGQDDADDKCITLVYELAAGSEPVDEQNVIWTIICANNNGNSMNTIYGTFDGYNDAQGASVDGDGDGIVTDAERLAAHGGGPGTVAYTLANSDSINVDGTDKLTDVDGDGAADDDDDILNPGEVYMIDLKVETEIINAGLATGSPDDTPAGVECSPQIGEEHTLVISVEGGGTTYETLSYSSAVEGDSVV